MAQHQEDDGADEHIRKYGGPLGDSSAGAHEQARADGTADCDELDVAVAQTAVQSLSLFGALGFRLTLFCSVTTSSFHGCTPYRRICRYWNKSR